MRRIALIAWLAGFPLAAFAATPVLVRDLDPRLAGPGHPGGTLTSPARAGSRIVFVVSPGQAGEADLWASDGTTAGTERLRSFPGHTEVIGSTGSVVFFSETAVADFRELTLWRTDGTVGGTFPLGPQLGSFEDALSWTVYRGALLFSGCTPEWGCELWRSDGTPEGTRRVREIVPGRAGGAPRELTVAGDAIYFFANDVAGPGLWRTDGTTSGTRKAVALPTFSTPRSLLASGLRLFFLDGGTYNPPHSLWTSDGTPGGTRPVPPFDHARSGGPEAFLFVFQQAGQVYFIGIEKRRSAQLWTTDGTARGTRRLTSFPLLPPGGGYVYPAPGEMLAVGGRLLFIGPDHRLWTTRGTSSSTQPLAGCTGECPHIGSFLPAGGRLFFSDWSHSDRQELWVTDGTGAGTRRIAALGTDRTLEIETALGGNVLFTFGEQLWRTDGTAGGTVLLEQDLVSYSHFFPVLGGRAFFDTVAEQKGLRLGITDGTPQGTHDLEVRFGNGLGSNPAGLAPIGGGALFTTCHPFEIGTYWLSDGTRDGTVTLPPKAFCSDQGQAQIRVQVLGGAAFFAAPQPDDYVNQVWRTDGTASGTTRLTTLGTSEEVAELILFRGKLLFTTYAQSQASFWSSDGTAAGTTRLFSRDKPFPFNLQAAGDQLFFLAWNTRGTTDLWRSDGTAAGTLPLMPAGSAGPMVAVAGAVYFLADGALVRTDGTPEGTRQVLPNPALRRSPRELKGLVGSGGSLYFLADKRDGDEYPPPPPELFRSDGTIAGTVSLGVVGLPGESYAWAEPRFTAAGGFLYFAATDEAHGTELWRTDGTREGMVMVSDVFPGADSSQPEELTADGGRLFFTADDGLRGRELWVTRGAPGDARRVFDLAPGAASSSPRSLAISGGRLFFSADDGTLGRELWLLPLTSTDP